MTEKKDLAIGGQALIEGVMMKGDKFVAAAIKDPDGKIVVEKMAFQPIVKRFKFLNLPFVRGFINLLEMMYIGTKMLMKSAEISLEEEHNMSTWSIVLTMITSFSFSILLFIVLPAAIFTFLKSYVESTILLNLLEGLVRFLIFIFFLLFTLLFKDMRRVYEYHGAEHKTIHAYEDGAELNPENIREHVKEHDRCGTSFILVVMVISIIMYTFLGRPDFLHRILYKLLMLPIVSGIAYEVIKLKGNNILSKLLKILIYPGILLQKITTREPDDEQIKVAVIALKEVL